ncbi:uncharacterized protein MELLADRAFT_62323 [Melampsora larici-populina 98AG31]|uniref:Uncharacterized protein n=1 Tax=Melampsora larici-populina (strain 98AG31 / pathotype 3-4-7) TaxID=747676 RepID=F4RIJ7_MELLP|nr:uncharacterized protein MELLADRAFT_62323 [Melampsora larici-populina 98AG31]EGG07579.1 hypothetical protein MELLADRAFT_62323 [Melampsora larici-populina 98AG31]
MPSRTNVDKSDDVTLSLSEVTPSGDSPSAITSPRSTSTSSLVEIPTTRSSSRGTLSGQGSVEPAVKPSNETERAATKAGQSNQNPRAIYKLRARPAVRHAPSEDVYRCVRTFEVENGDAGSVICVTIPNRVSSLRIDLPSKRAAFLYRLDGFYEHGSKPTYCPENSSGFSESVVIYEMGRKVDLSKTRDINEWQVRELQGDGVDLPFRGIARFHMSWLSMARSGRERAVEVVNAHSYVSSMLQLFKDRLLKLWQQQKLPDGVLAMEFCDWFLSAAALHVILMFLSLDMYIYTWRTDCLLRDFLRCLVFI